MIGPLANHLWQSTVFALLIGVLTLALRRNGAAIRYTLWWIASAKFFVPFSLFVLAGGLIPWHPVETADVSMSAQPLAIVFEQMAEPVAGTALVSAPAARTTADVTPFVLLTLWGTGALMVAIARLRAWTHVRAVLRASQPSPFGAVSGLEVRSAPGLLEPGVVGLWRPILLVPAGIEHRLTERQLAAVLAHEQCHAGRHDNLTAAFHMVVESVFWFHPLVWWIGARLFEERERACDEHVLNVIGEPHAYAEGILNVCRLYAESPIACVSGVTGSNLKKRIENILVNPVRLELSFTRKAALVFTALAVLAVPVVAGALTARPPAQSPAQQGSAAFDVASVKPCVAEKGRAPGQHIDTSLHRAYFECFTVATLLDLAYTRAGDFSLNGHPERNIRGGPDWISTERYTIEATTAASMEAPGLTGAMLRTLLEDRFHLRSHQAVEEISMYGLTVAKGGLKIKPLGAGECVEVDRDAPMAKPGQKPDCGSVAGRRRGTIRIWEMGGASLGDLADVLDVDRRVLDQTGISGRFNIHIEYEMDENSTTGVTVFTALEEQLGLKLVPTKGPHQYLVVDHIERPNGTIGNDRERSETIGNGRDRSETMGNGRERSETIGNGRQRSGTTANGRGAGR